MSVHQRDDGRCIVVFKGTDGKRKERSFGRGPDAEAAAYAFDEAMRSRDIAPVVQQPLGPVLKQAVDSYLDNLRAQGKSQSHISNVQYMATSLLYKHFGPLMPLDLINYADGIVPFINHMRTVPSKRTGAVRSQASVNRYCCFLRTIFNFAVANGLMAQNPISQWRKTKEPPRQFQISLEDVAKIMKHADAHVRWAIEVCFNLGVRSGDSELLSLRWIDVDWERKQVRVYGRKTKTYRIIPIKDTFLERLREMRAISRTEFIIEYRGKRVNRIQKAFRMACRRAGIEHSVRMYDLRHMFATYMLSNGADLAAVSKLLGHSSVTMTANVYYQYLEGEKERAVTLLPDLPQLGQVPSAQPSA
ncbi:tyrosine-type recombinase/integrase [Desulfovibrio desulfuricans]|uniref:tyrosine-type recombinase/integrase n=1 Tax=Desulfovibrio desulfuricans TaxID=876 RepID=UPI001AE28B70|nr:site-specific integrase [Desulfovibrio desulfuricans]QTO40875.1 site-specific integrase [Desulfovibrio desulfuricans]